MWVKGAGEVGGKEMKAHEQLRQTDEKDPATLCAPRRVCALWASSTASLTGCSTMHIGHRAVCKHRVCMQAHLTLATCIPRASAVRQTAEPARGWGVNENGGGGAVSAISRTDETVPAYDEYLLGDGLHGDWRLKRKCELKL